MKWSNRITTFLLNLSVMALAILIIKSQDDSKYDKSLAEVRARQDSYNSLVATNNLILKDRYEKLIAAQTKIQAPAAVTPPAAIIPKTTPVTVPKPAPTNIITPVTPVPVYTPPAPAPVINRTTRTS